MTKINIFHDQIEKPTTFQAWKMIFQNSMTRTNPGHVIRTVSRLFCDVFTLCADFRTTASRSFYVVGMELPGHSKHFSKVYLRHSIQPAFCDFDYASTSFAWLEQNPFSIPSQAIIFNNFWNFHFSAGLFYIICAE